jgi:uncharacterized protein involved in exopolysaccharide biosynthesis
MLADRPPARRVQLRFRAVQGAPDPVAADPGRANVPRFDIVTAAVRNVPLLVIPALVLTGVGVALGLARQPVYTAEAQLNVGRTNVEAQAIPGIVEGSKSLAGSYARAMHSPGILEPTARAVGRPSGEILEKISASQVAESPAISVEAEGDGVRESTALANAGARSIVAYADRVNANVSHQRSLLRQFGAAERDAARLDARAGGAREGSDAEAELAAQAQTARLRARALSGAYQDSLRSSSVGFVQVVSPATGATNDRSSTAQRLGLIGFAAGAFFGLALAIARTRAQARASLR